MTPIPGITRYAYQRGTGWLARFYTVDRVHTKLFSDSRYGFDPARSLAAAQHHLAALAATLEPRPRYRRSPSRRPGGGRVGICLRQKRERNGQAFWVYDVSYRQQGRRRTRTFRVGLYPSRQAAFTAAQAFRQAAERAMQRERRAQLRQQWEAGPEEGGTRRPA